MADTSGRDLDKLAALFQQGHRIADAASVAGNALAMPMARLRGRQAAMEAKRAEHKLGADHKLTRERAAQAAMLATRHQALERELDRQTLLRPDPGRQAALYGRVTKAGEPQPGLLVAVLDEEDETLVHSCTGVQGDYSMSFAPERPVRIEVRGEGRKRLFRDETAAAYPAYRVTHRDIELAGTKPPCPDEDPTPAPVKALVGVPSVVNIHLSSAIANLEALGLRLGKQSVRSGDRVDIVLQQFPGPGTMVEPGSSVDVVVSRADPKPATEVGDLAGHTLNRAIGEIQKAGAEIGSVTVSKDGPRTPTVAASTADSSGAAVHLDVSMKGGDAALMQVAATVIAATPEAAEAGITTPTAAVDWLKERKLGTLTDVREAAALDDDGLRKRLKLGKNADLGTARKLLHAAVNRIREV